MPPVRGTVPDTRAAGKRVVNPAQLMTTAEVAELLRVSRRTVDRMVFAGDLPVVTVSKSRRFRRDDVDELLTARRYDRTA